MSGTHSGMVATGDGHVSRRHVVMRDMHGDL